MQQHDLVVLAGTSLYVPDFLLVIFDLPKVNISYLGVYLNQICF